MKGAEFSQTRELGLYEQSVIQDICAHHLQWGWFLSAAAAESGWHVTTRDHCCHDWHAKL